MQTEVKNLDEKNKEKVEEIQKSIQSALDEKLKEFMSEVGNISSWLL